MAEVVLSQYFQEAMTSERTLQQQVRERLIDAILDGALPPHLPLPSTRGLAESIGVSRNTVVLVYQQLIDDGYLTPVGRRGHFINEQYVSQQLKLRGDTRTASLFEPGPEGGLWAERLVLRASRMRHIVKPANWREYEHPFIFGQVTPDKLSVARWRDCVRYAGSSRHMSAWVNDLVDCDDPMLISQIITRILPQRGIRATQEEIILSIGSQNALFMTAQLLTGPGVTVGVENPGYLDAFNIFRLLGARLRPLGVDAKGVMVTDALAECDLVCVTPSHQAPTSVTLSLDRRLALVERARADDFLIIEDDYEHELNYIGASRAALKSYDNSNRIIYIGSLTKTLFPGLRIGFIVGPRPFIEELRALRRLTYRHPPALDQRAMAIFISEGHHDSHIRRARAQLAAKWTLLQRELARRLPECGVRQTSGGSSLWLAMPEGVDCWEVQREAARRSVLIEPGDMFYLEEDAPKNRLRLGFAAIEKEKIGPGVALLAEAIAAAAPRR